MEKRNIKNLEYPNMVSPVENEIPNPAYFDENKCIVFPNKECLISDSEGIIAIHNEPITEFEDEREREQKDSKAQDSNIEYVTDEVLSMMLFSDIHDHCLFPFRTNQVIKEAKHKFPFNKPLGIKTAEVGVSEFLDQLIQHIEGDKPDAYSSIYAFNPLEEVKDNTYLHDVIINLEKSIKEDPITELAKLQLDEESSHRNSNSQEILPNEIFYSLQQERKMMYDGKEEAIDLTSEEKSDKIHTTFIHDKMLFDSFNHALNIVAKRKVEMPPWHFGTQALSQKRYSKSQAI